MSTTYTPELFAFDTPNNGTASIAAALAELDVIAKVIGLADDTKLRIYWLLKGGGPYEALRELNQLIRSFASKRGLRLDEPQRPVRCRTRRAPIDDLKRGNRWSGHRPKDDELDKFEFAFNNGPVLDVAGIHDPVARYNRLSTWRPMWNLGAKVREDGLVLAPHPSTDGPHNSNLGVEIAGQRVFGPKFSTTPAMWVRDSRQLPMPPRIDLTSVTTDTEDLVEA